MTKQSLVCLATLCALLCCSVTAKRSGLYRVPSSKSVKSSRDVKISGVKDVTSEDKDNLWDGLLRQMDSHIFSDFSLSMSLSMSLAIAIPVSTTPVVTAPVQTTPNLNSAIPSTSSSGGLITSSPTPTPSTVLNTLAPTVLSSGGLTEPTSTIAFSTLLNTLAPTVSSTPTSTLSATLVTESPLAFPTNRPTTLSPKVQSFPTVTTTPTHLTSTTLSPAFSDSVATSSTEAPDEAEPLMMSPPETAEIDRSIGSSPTSTLSVPNVPPTTLTLLSYNASNATSKSSPQISRSNAPVMSAAAAAFAVMAVFGAAVLVYRRKENDSPSLLSRGEGGSFEDFNGWGTLNDVDLCEEDMYQL